MPAVRLNKALALAGVASRRKADALIEAGRVAVNDEVVRALGTVIDPERDRLTVDGRPIREERLEYWIVHKPLDVLTAVSDDRGRAVARDLVPTTARVYPVGRLDADSTGLLLFTNDGELAHRLMHPRFAHSKRYEVLVSGFPGPDVVARLRAGVELDDGPTLPASVRVMRTTKGATWLEIALRQGRKRQIRRMLEAVGHPVVHLRRVAIGTVSLGRLEEGEARRLSAAELSGLRRIAGLKAPADAPPARRAAPTNRPARARSGARPRSGARAADRSTRPGHGKALPKA